MIKIVNSLHRVPKILIYCTVSGSVKLTDEFSYIHSRIRNICKKEKPGKLTDGNIYHMKTKRFLLQKGACINCVGGQNNPYGKRETESLGQW